MLSRDIITPRSFAVLQVAHWFTSQSNAEYTVDIAWFYDVMLFQAIILSLMFFISGKVRWLTETSKYRVKL
jgi:hypothetical protein